MNIFSKFRKSPITKGFLEKKEVKNVRKTVLDAKSVMCKKCIKKLKHFQMKLPFTLPSEKKIDVFIDSLCGECKKYVK